MYMHALSNIFEIDLRNSLSTNEKDLQRSAVSLRNTGSCFSPAAQQGRALGEERGRLDGACYRYCGLAQPAPGPLRLLIRALQYGRQFFWLDEAVMISVDLGEVGSEFLTDGAH